jgi:hypothetical protein
MPQWYPQTEETSAEATVRQFREAAARVRLGLSAPRCQATVYVRDTYRRTGRGRSGFELHYTRRQCSRHCPEGEQYCWQHRPA